MFSQIKKSVATLVAVAGAGIVLACGLAEAGPFQQMAEMAEEAIPFANMMP